MSDEPGLDIAAAEQAAEATLAGYFPNRYSAQPVVSRPHRK